MKRILLLGTFCLTVSISSFAQSKMNFSLVKKTQEVAGRSRSQPIDVFIKGDVSIIKQLILANGGTFKYASGDIAVVQLSVDQIGAIVTNKAIQRIEAYPPHTRLMNDTVEVNSNILAVHTGQSPLTQAYDGTGIVVGFLDTGIDFNHPDFKDANGKSRVKYLWDQTQPLAGNTPQPYGYGQEWTNLDIDAGLASAHKDSINGGHGTHVAGVGVGNGLATGGYKGVAPGADIIMVGIDFNNFSSTTNIDAVNYIYSKAQEMGKPCVINASLGDYFGSHDGKDLQAQIISSMIDAQPGRAFVAAVGNAGDISYHLGYTVTADTNFTMANAGGKDIYLQMWADTNDFKNVEFAIGADQISPTHSFRGSLPFTNIASHLGILSEDTLYNNNKRIGIIQSYGDLIGGTYSMEFYIIPDSNYNWRLSTTGSGKFDLWSFDLISTNLPSAVTMPDSIYYKLPDVNMTTVSSFQCLDNVIAVGNYVNRRGYTDYNNTPYLNTAITSGQRVASSSIGPTRDGRIKPDIVAPGDMTMAAVVLTVVPLIVAGFPDALALGGYHVRTGGSSHASPVVAGVAALYLQKNPTATAMEVKQAIINCPKQDGYTGSNLPNNYWGYGKVNGFGALTCGLSNVKDINQDHSFLIYPNPVYNGTSLTIYVANIKATDKAELKIYNALGELLKIIPVTDPTVQLNAQFLPGIYFCCLQMNRYSVATEKLVILEGSY